jgi:hypothetical protein
LKNSVWIGLLWTSSGGVNWTDDTWNSFAWVNQNATFNAFLLRIHTLSSFSTSSSHFLISLHIHGYWNNHETFWNPKLDLSSSCLFNFVEIKGYIFNFFWDFCFFFPTFYVDIEIVTFSCCVCFMIPSSLIAYWALFFGWIEPYFLTLRFGLNDNFESNSIRSDQPIVHPYAH